MKPHLSNAIDSIRLPKPLYPSKTLLAHCSHFLSYHSPFKTHVFRTKLRSKNLSVLLGKHRKLRISACSASGSGSDSVVASTKAEEDAESTQLFEVLLLNFVIFWVKLSFGYWENGRKEKKKSEKCFSFFGHLLFLAFMGLLSDGKITNTKLSSISLFWIDWVMKFSVFFFFFPNKLLLLRLCLITQRYLCLVISIMVSFGWANLWFFDKVSLCERCITVPIYWSQFVIYVRSNLW